MAGDGNGRAELPRIAVIGAGIFARTQYIPRLREIAHLVVLKSIWSRTQESAKAAAELARDFAPDIECKWGDAGLEEIMGDSSIMGVAIVLAGQVQVELSLKMLKAGKHVIQEKPASQQQKQKLHCQSTTHFKTCSRINPFGQSERTTDLSLPLLSQAS
ncbi:NAD-dependent dihydrogenase, Gfo/Idh/MocA family [Zea mays]|uniref:NAD-dependent dihydrogenase, Gfo/Idh/MocA family n=1 Tax=Zea mays TaxID=4577 RepID=A0A1D6EKK8_MAIZE|nr:NAD-dependent dihydrogenase, Gfo/Idh/MocA family [Zea mays]